MLAGKMYCNPLVGRGVPRDVPKHQRRRWGQAILEWLYSSINEGCREETHDAWLNTTNSLRLDGKLGYESKIIVKQYNELFVLFKTWLLVKKLCTQMNLESSSWRERSQGMWRGLSHFTKRMPSLIFPLAGAIGATNIRIFYEKLLASKPNSQGDVRASLINGEFALTSTRFSGGATAEVARRQTDGSWLWIIDKPNILG